MKSWSCLPVALGLITTAALAEEVQTSAGTLTIAPIFQGFEEPWALDFLPDASFLVTERDGRLWHVTGEKARQVSGVPEVYPDGQGGLLDVMIPRDFATSREVWLTYSIEQPAGSGTAVGKGRLSNDTGTLEGFVTLFAIPEGSSGGEGAFRRGLIRRGSSSTISTAVVSMT